MERQAQDDKRKRVFARSMKRTTKQSQYQRLPHCLRSFAMSLHEVLKLPSNLSITPEGIVDGPETIKINLSKFMKLFF